MINEGWFPVEGSPVCQFVVCRGPRFDITIKCCHRNDSFTGEGGGNWVDHPLPMISTGDLERRAYGKVKGKRGGRKAAGRK